MPCGSRKQSRLGDSRGGTIVPHPFPYLAPLGVNYVLLYRGGVNYPIPSLRLVSLCLDCFLIKVSLRNNLCPHFNRQRIPQRLIATSVATGRRLGGNHSLSVGLALIAVFFINITIRPILSSWRIICCQQAETLERPCVKLEPVSCHPIGRGLPKRFLPA